MPKSLKLTPLAASNLTAGHMASRHGMTGQATASSVEVGAGHQLSFIAGPCVMESLEHTVSLALELKKLSVELGVEIIFKASFDKANRSSVDAYRGPGIDKGAEILRAVKDATGMMVTTDIHTVEDVEKMAQVCEILQIPAFLSRQTDLILAAGRSGRCVNVKKGQFLAPWDCKNIADKLTRVGCTEMIITERGASFGYNNLVSDMRAIPILHENFPVVCFDASHSLQLPGGGGTHSGGLREYIPHLARASVAAGADMIFIECHDRPEQAMSDRATVFPISELKTLFTELIAIRSILISSSLTS